MDAEEAKLEIRKMGIESIDKILLEKYNIAMSKLKSYPDDIKRDLLLDLEASLAKI